MFDDEQYAQNGQQPQQDPMAQQMPPPIDPQELERIRQEVEMAHEEFERLMNGKRRLYSQYR